MNDYFIAIGPTLASKINPVEGFSDTSHIYKISPTISQVPLDGDTLQKHLSTITSRKTSSPDSITPRDLRLLGEAATQGLYTVIKGSLNKSTVPTQWKISRMHTIYKKGDTSDKGNYRPLQMLSVPSKILEATVCKGLDNFISDTGLLSNNQWGFRPGRSTESLLVYLIETWKQALDNGQVVGVVIIIIQCCK